MFPSSPVAYNTKKCKTKFFLSLRGGLPSIRRKRDRVRTESVALSV